MKREIKFRAWDSKTGIMFYDVQNLYDGVGVSPEEPNQPIYDSLLGTYSFGEVLSSKQPVMQYTGLKDKNGVEIYEGDIMKGDYDRNYVVEFSELNYDGGGGQASGFYFKEFCGELQYSVNMPEYEVIGNVYQNPDLLK